MSEWISVDDRLPSMGQKCITVYQGQTQNVAYIFDGYCWTNADDEEIITECVSDFTHWRQLPAPPK